MNNIFYKILFSIILIFCICTSVISATLLPLGLHPYDFIYNKLERIETIEQDSYVYTVAPYLLDKKKFDLAPLTFLQNQTEKKLHIFFIGNESFSSQTLTSFETLEAFRIGLTGSLSKNITLYTNISLDEQKAKDQTYTGKKWRGLAGGVEQSFLSLQFNNLNIFIGKFKSYWGIKKSLVLSESNALDGFQYTYRYKKLSLTYRIAKLSQLETDLTTSVFNNRYFAGHRLDINLHKKLRIGLFESIIFGGVGRTLEFNYLNPLTSYHVEQLNNNVNDNSFLGFDFTYYPFQKTKLYGQVLIDDYQIEKESQGDQEPNQYGLIIGGYFVDIYDSYDMRVEYIKITNRTYNQAHERNRYTFENNSIGYFESNDFDKINLSLTKWISPQNTLSLHYSYKRKGEGNINDLWTEPWLETTADYNELFPFGIVENTNRISCQFKGFLLQNFYIDSEFGVENIKNRNNQCHNSEQNKFINVSFYSFISKIM